MGKRAVVPPGKHRVRVAESVWLKANGKFLAQFRDPGRKQHWKEFRTLAEAKRWRARAAVDPSSLHEGKRTLEEVWTDFWRHQGGNVRPTTRANWEQEWRAHIRPALGTWPIGKISVLVIKDFLAELERRGVGAETRRKCRSILHRLFAEAVENGEVASNPVSARGTRVAKPQPKRQRPLSPEEVRRVLEVARRTLRRSDALAIETLFCLGLRLGELAGLQARDVDVGRGEVVVRRTVTEVGGRLSVQDATKTNKYRVLPVPAELPLWPNLVAHLKREGVIGQAPLFPAVGGGPIRPNNWRRRVWSRAMQEAGVVNAPTPHAARRTTASLLTGAGVPTPTVQRILGHSTLQQTGEYIDVSSDEMANGIGRLKVIYPGAGADGAT